MQRAYDPLEPKQSADTSEKVDLLRRAKELGIKLSATLELALALAPRQKQRKRWIADNKLAIEAYNEGVEENGIFSDGLRSF
jgi:antitoxin CcdA